MKLLTLDIGNTHVTCGIFKNDILIYCLRIDSNLNFKTQFKTLKKFTINNIAISSVVPNLTKAYKEVCINYFNIEPFIITSQNANIKLLVDSPNEVGVDRICNVAATQKMVGTPAIVGDIGSATNYDVIDIDGSFIGGAIAPGIKIAAENLIKRAALLNKSTFIVPNNAVGKTTESNLQSGIMLGAIDLIDGMFERIRNEMKWNKNYIIITGGFGKLIAPHLKTKHKLIPHLTLNGIKFIYENQ